MPLVPGQAAVHPSGRWGHLPGWAENLLFLAFLALCIVAITWPWATGFGHAFANHWDPPLHAWKVWNMADAILHGRIRPPGIDLNAYYPSSGSLYYESLYWPQGIVAAPILAVSGNPVLAFHLSYLFFWAFSGLCFRWLLLELGTSRAAANLGALVFTVFPYRTGYIVEFNMQLCFGLPLFLLFALRWSKTQRPLDAAFAATALCLQAASELYQAVFLCLCMPFALLAMFHGRWRAWLSSRRFWLSVVAAAGVTLVFVLVLFLPYLAQLGHSVSRPLHEIARHELEPFSYLASDQHMRWSLLPVKKVLQDEICVYPTLAVLVVALLQAARSLAVRLSSPDTPRTERVLRLLRALAVVSFLVSALVGILAKTLGRLAPVYAWLPVAIVLLSLAIPIVSRYRCDTDRFLDAMCGAAVFAFLMSLGPRLTVYGDPWNMDNPLFLWLYNASSILHGFRVVARFGVIVLLFLVLSMACAWDGFLRAHAGGKGLRAALVRFSWAPLLALVVCESVPGPLPPPREGTPLALPFLDDLQGRTGDPVVLATVPGMDRYFDSMNMFRIAGANQRRLLVMSWGGAWPQFIHLAQRNFRKLSQRPERFHRQFASIWPECFLLLDRIDLPRSMDEETGSAYCKSLSQIADPIHTDERYTLYRFHPLPANTIAERWVRTDFMRAWPIARFRIVPAPLDGESFPSGNVAVSVSLDRWPITKLTVPGGGQEFQVRLPDVKPHPVNSFCILFESDRPFSIEDFRCLPLTEADSSFQASNQKTSP